MDVIMDTIQQKLLKVQPPKKYVELGSKVFAVLNVIITTILTGVTLYWFITKHYVMLLPFITVFSSSPELMNPLKPEDFFEAAAGVFGKQSLDKENQQIFGKLLDSDQLQSGKAFGPFEMLVLWVAMPLTLTGLFFSAILVIAIIKKRPYYVRAYILFGVSTIIMCIMTNIYLAAAFRLETRPSNYDVVVCSSILFYVIYSAILAMYWRTYKDLKAEIQLQHTPLHNMNNPCDQE